MILHGRIVCETIDSVVLRDNPLGDPATREFPVYLPPSYDSDPARRFPVLYILTGFTGRALMYLNVDLLGPSKAWSASIGSGVQPAARCGRGVSPVFPDCFSVSVSCSVVCQLPLPAAAAGDHVIDELIPAIDARFRTVALSRDGRGVIGKSSGGYGALWLGMRRMPSVPSVYMATATSNIAIAPTCRARSTRCTPRAASRHGSRRSSPRSR